MCARDQESISVRLTASRLNDTSLFSGTSSFRGSQMHEFHYGNPDIDTLKLVNPYFITISFDELKDSIVLIWDKDKKTIFSLGNNRKILSHAELKYKNDNLLTGAINVYLSDNILKEGNPGQTVELEVRILPSINLILYRSLIVHTGTFKAGKKSYGICIFRDMSLDYKELPAIRLGVDRDQSGTFSMDNSLDKNDIFHPTEIFDADQPFIVDGKPYEVESVSPSGDRITIRRSGTKSSLNIGFTAPSFYFSPLEGDSLNINDFKGKLVVINLWAKWCSACFMEMPQLNQLVEKYKNSNVVFLALAPDNKEDILKVLENRKFDYSIGLISYDLANKFFGGNSAYPQHIIIDRSGKVIFRQFGAATNDIEMLGKIIERMK